MQASFIKKRLNLDKQLNKTDKDLKLRNQLYKRKESISKYINKLLDRYLNR